MPSYIVVPAWALRALTGSTSRTRANSSRSEEAVMDSAQPCGADNARAGSPRGIENRGEADARAPGNRAVPRPSRSYRWPYELADCDSHPPILAAADARIPGLGDDPGGRQPDQLRWHRCLGCDSWVMAPADVAPVASRHNPHGAEQAGLPHRVTAARPREDWRFSAACRSADPELFFPISSTGACLAQVMAAKAICDQCPVRTECLAFALRTGQTDGIWGGLTEQERQRAAGTRGPGRSRRTPTA
jgi:WhiB family redox-sensing transcriptional regulator